MTRDEKHEAALADLRSAAADRATVTVVRGDDRAFTGTATEHPTQPGTFVIQTGRRGRPAIIHEDDVEEVVFE